MQPLYLLFIVPVSQPLISFVVLLDTLQDLQTFFQWQALKLNLVLKSPDSIHWLIVATGNSQSPIRYANASL